MTSKGASSAAAATAPPSSQATKPLAPDAILARELDSLTPYLAAWDALAEARGRPYCAPAWMLSWWRYGRVGATELRVILVLERNELVGVGPFFAQLGPLGLVEIRLLAAGFSHRIGPLAREGLEPIVASVLARTLAEMQPRAASVVFEGIDANERWPELIAAAWPARRPPRVRTDLVMDAPTIELGGSYEDWMLRRHSKFRSETRRTARRLEEEGTHGSMRRDQGAIDTLFELHRARWAERGGTNVEASARETVASAARELAASGRVQTALLDSPAGPLAADLVVRAGSTAASWGGGFDPARARYAPGIQSMLVAIRALADQGVQIVDLGGGSGEGAYKLKFADANRPLAWRTLFPRGPRYPLIRLRLAPKHMMLALRPLARRLPRSQRQALKRLLGRGKG
jgi:CelD/BcsL family acetyltransferase involved in cellulose biosynthesis